MFVLGLVDHNRSVVGLLLCALLCVLYESATYIPSLMCRCPGHGSCVRHASLSLVNAQAQGCFAKFIRGPTDPWRLVWRGRPYSWALQGLFTWGLWIPWPTRQKIRLTLLPSFHWTQRDKGIELRDKPSWMLIINLQHALWLCSVYY